MTNLENHTILKIQIRFKTPTLQLDLCDYSDAYIVVEGKIIVLLKEQLIEID